ncbi:AtpZ/AtpI family protein, partial [Patescibacteria group bacterium]|nr:AtpZ/AtpI family protein [Patescibacteria group bacterium]
MEKEIKKVSSDAYYYFLAIRIAGDFGVTIAAPAIIASFLGKKLDENFSTYPIITLLLLTVAFIFT